MVKYYCSHTRHESFSLHQFSIYHLTKLCGVSQLKKKSNGEYEECLTERNISCLLDWCTIEKRLFSWYFVNFLYLHFIAVLLAILRLAAFCLMLHRVQSDCDPAVVSDFLYRLQYYFTLNVKYLELCSSFL